MVKKRFDGKRGVFLTIIMAACLAFFCCGCDRSGDAEIYVSAEAGDDDTGKGTQKRPWKTIVKGIDELGKDGKDTLVIRAGSYYVPDEIQMRRSGSAERSLIIRSFPGERVVLSNERDGVCTTGSRFILNIKRDDFYQGLEHITIEGLHFIGGITVGGSDQTCRDIRLESCTFTAHGANLGPDNPSLIYLRGTEDCSIRNCTLFCDDRRLNDFSGIKIWSGTKRLIVENNEIYGLARKGIDNKHGKPDQALVIRNNYIHHLNERAININADETVIENNVIYHCPAGINIWKESGSPGGSFSIINHNTIVDCDIGIMLEPESSGKLRGCRVTNNLLVNCGRGGFGAFNISPYRRTPYAHGHYSNHNCFYHAEARHSVRDRDDILYNLPQWQEVSELDGASIEMNPGFMLVENGETSLCGFRVSDAFGRDGRTRGDDGCTMGANVVSMPDGGCRLVVCAGGGAVRSGEQKISGVPGERGERSAGAPSPPRNVRVPGRK